MRNTKEETIQQLREQFIECDKKIRDGKRNRK